MSKGMTDAEINALIVTALTTPRTNIDKAIDDLSSDAGISLAKAAIMWLDHPQVLHDGDVWRLRRFGCVRQEPTISLADLFA